MILHQSSSHKFRKVDRIDFLNNPPPKSKNIITNPLSQGFNHKQEMKLLQIKRTNFNPSFGRGGKANILRLFSYWETCSQRGLLRPGSLKARSTSDLTFSRAKVSSLGHRLPTELPSPSSSFTPPAVGFSGRAVDPPSIGLQEMPLQPKKILGITNTNKGKD